MWQSLMEYYKSDWSYVVADNHNALKIYKHWGDQFYPNLKVNFMDLALRKDPITQKTVSLHDNIKFFESRLSCFGFKQGLGFEVVELATDHFQEIAKQRGHYQNDINTHFTTFSMDGLQVVIDNPRQAACLAILFKGKVFGVITLMKYYFLYFDPTSAQHIHSDANIYILQALQRFLVDYSSNISSDTSQPIRKIF